MTKRRWVEEPVQKNTPEELACTQAHRFFNLSLDLLTISNDNGYFTHLNPAWERTLGFTLEELKTQPFIEFVHPEDREVTQSEMAKLGVGLPVTIQFENRYRCKDGSYKWLSWMAVPCLEEGLTYGVARDISEAYTERCLRQQAETALQRANEELETRVAERTAHLRQVNDELVVEIVNHRHVELALRKSEQQYRTLVETIPHGIQEIDTTGIITFTNSAYDRILGYKPGEPLGKSISSLVPESERLTVAGYLTMLVQEQPAPTPYLGKNLTQDGSLIDVQVDWNYKRDEQGQLTGFISVITDITERKRMEESLRESEKQYRYLFEANPHPMWVYELETLAFLAVNDATVSHYGYSRAEFLAMTIREIRPPEDVPVLLKTLSETEPQSGINPMGVWRHRKKDGTLIDVEITHHEFLFGERRARLVLAHDITERKQIEEALRTSEERFRIALQNSPIVVFTQDTELRYTWIYNPALGYEAEEVVGKLESEIFSPEDTQTLAAIKHQVLTTGIGTREQTVVTFKGEVRYYDLTVEPLHNQAGEVVGITCAATDITDIHAREQELQAIFEGSLDAIAIADDAGTYIEANPAASQLFGLPLSELLGRRIVDFMEPNFDFELAWRSFQEQGQLTGELRLIRPDSTGRDVEFAAKANFLPGQHLSILRDITERKQAEEARRKTEQLYRTLASNFPNGAVALFDKDLRYTLTEGKGLTEVGLSKEFLQGKTVAEIFPPDVCQIKERAYRAALDGNPTICEIPFGERFYQMYALPLRNERGEIYAGMSLSQDISDRKRAELALLEERNFVSAILDTAGALIVVADQQGKIISFNRACEQLTGYSFNEVKGKYIWDLFLIPEEIEPVKAVFQELQAGHFPNEHENYWLARDGSRRLLCWSNTVLFDADGSVKSIIGIGIDVTDRKRAEEIRRALEREQELSELRLRFFSMVSHEFRTPLSTILVSAQSLESRAHEWPEQKRRKNLRRIESAAKNLTQLLDDILTINRAETGKLEFNPHPIELENFCQALLEEIQLQNSNKNTICFSIYGSCKNLFLDKKLLHSILNNLLSNAIKYSPEGAEIHWIVDCKQGEIIFQIHDQGIGISLSDKLHLFEPFYRGKNVGNIPGTGLGITVVKKCLDLHGGKISLNSEVGVGTTVTVTIPQP